MAPCAGLGSCSLLLLVGSLGCWATHAEPTAHAPAAAPHRRGEAIVVHTRTAAAEPSVAAVASVREPVEVHEDPVPPDDANEGCVASVRDLPAAPHVDPRDRRLERRGLLVAVKSSRRLMLFDRGTLAGCWRIGLGFSPQGHKQVEGDGKTPVGWYPTSDKPWSVFDDAIAIHYPNAEDAQAAWHAGRISRRTRDAIDAASAERSVPPQTTAVGGAVLIHGGGSTSDWTLGCIALDDEDLADLRGRLPRRMRTDLLVIE